MFRKLGLHGFFFGGGGGRQTTLVLNPFIIQLLYGLLDSVTETPTTVFTAPTSVTLSAALVGGIAGGVGGGLFLVIVILIVIVVVLTCHVKRLKRRGSGNIVPGKCVWIHRVCEVEQTSIPPSTNNSYWQCRN